MRMAVEGMGVVSAGGNSPLALAQNAQLALRGERRSTLASKADTTALAQYVPTRNLRRVDHFTRMVLLAAYSALEDAGLTSADLGQTGIVLATGYGPARLTFDFLDSIIDFGPEMASPQAFAHSVHNIPAATIALMVGLRGPCFTICQLDTAFAAAALTARTWMAENRVTRVLLGAVDEHTDLLDVNSRRIASELLSETSGGRRDLLPGEGAVFFCLHADPAHARHGFFEEISMSRGGTRVGADPVFFSGSASSERRGSMDLMFDLSPAYGNIPIAMAFDATLALLAIQGLLSPIISGNAAVQCQSRDRFGVTGSIRVTSGSRP